MKSPRLGFLALLVGLAGLNLLYLWYSPFDLCGDEAHYWEWSRHLDICYYSKGPVVAYLIWLATYIGGHSAFAIRTVAVVLSAGSMVIVYLLGSRLFKSEGAGFLAVLLLVSAPMINIGAAVLTIDSPLCFFWLAAVGAWYLAVFEKRPAWWYVGGICASVAFLAKFTALFLLPGLLLFLLISREDRRWLRTPYPYLAVLLGLLGFVPFIVWNAQHGWVTVHHLMALGGAGRSRLFNPMGIPMFLFQTAAVLSPIVFGLLAYGIWKSTALGLRGGNRSHLFCQVFVWPLLLFYLPVALRKHVPVNWPFTSYLTGMIAAGAILAERLSPAYAGAQRLRKWIIAAVAVGVVISVTLRYTFVFYPLMDRVGLSAGMDHAAKQFMGYREIGARVSDTVREMAQKDGREPFIFSDNYRLSSALGFYTDKRYTTYCINVGQRRNQYDFWPGIEGFTGRNAVYAGEQLIIKGDTSRPDTLSEETLAKAFKRVERQPPLEIRRMGVLVKQFEVYKCYDFTGWTPPEKQRRY